MILFTLTVDDEVLTFNGDARLISGANRAREIIFERDSTINLLL